VWKLPIIWIKENNGLSQSVKLGKTWATDRIAKIAANYNMPGKTVDGYDAIAIAEAAEEFIERARQGRGPSLLELITYRWRGHFEGEAMKYRTREEIKEWQAKDPVVRLEKQLLERGVTNQELINKIKADADMEVAEAQKFADESPEPNPKDMLSKVYASSHT
jgi:pyruvate dehydrogenase E1 component alpha subunit